MDSIGWVVRSPVGFRFVRYHLFIVPIRMTVYERDGYAVAFGEACDFVKGIYIYIRYDKLRGFTILELSWRVEESQGCDR
jgi:hypothetical protein